MVWGGRREEGSGWGTHVYLWRIHVDVWQNQYNIVKFKNKIKKNTCTPMFIAILFILTRTCPRCLSTDEWIKKWWCVYTHTHTHKNMTQP